MVRYNLFFDGACSNNGKKNSKMGAGVYIEIYKTKDSKPQIVEYCKFLGRGGTNNEAEYTALYLGLNIIFNKLNATLDDKIYVYGDSNLVIKQVTGEWQCKAENLLWYNLKIMSYKDIQKKNLIFKHIYRENNEIADELSKKGLSMEGKQGRIISAKY